MEHSNGVGVTGRLALWLIDPYSMVVEETRSCRNLVVTAGLQWLAGKMCAGSGQAGLSHIAVGTGSVAPLASDASLGSELDRAALSLDPWQGTGDAANNWYVRAAFSQAEAVGTLAEAGLFYGSMLFARTLISPTVAKPADKILIMQWGFAFNAL